ncbi:FHA domain-containing protein [Actinoplanes siamensis]|uniref:FHA domain-containing protein n=1 Tax=Actinoplanes siamensis TaxID=1223317 RepID=A0A919N989_9ACTN|nr:FHA domain-containing protein [Actinoplanes siamensis]GIF06853.1 hypothetical protein Asi03nite_43910 [Actinoplanes siamensis]
MSDDGELWCPRGAERYPAGAGYFCPRHPGVELEPARVQEGPGAGGGAAGEPRAVCWACGARTTDVRNDTCTACHESLVPPALVIAFPAGRVVLPRRGTTAELGRAGEYGRLFARYPNVSRRHATAGVDEDGTAWLEPVPEAPNGTFVNDREIHGREPVRPGDRIRFAAGHGARTGPVSAPISQPDQAR